MADKRQVLVEILGDASKYSKVMDDASGKAGGFGDAVGNASKIALGVGVAGIGALVSQIGFGAKALADQNQALAISANAITKMGDASWTSVAKVNALAGQIQDYSGIDDTAIIKTENMLLTFGNIQDRVGKGNDVFTQSTKLAADMSVIMGTDATQSALQLGKALNDPIKGLTALQRVGVAFTKEQKDAITADMKRGDTLGAQQVILKELTREFGGAAEAAGQGTGVFKRLGATFEDFQKLLASAVLPIVENVATALIGFIQSPAVQNAGKQISEAFAQVPIVFASMKASIDSLVQQVWPPLEAAFNWLTDNGTNMVPILGAIAAVVMLAVVPALVSMVAAASPIILIIAAVAAAGALLAKAWTSDFMGIQEITGKVGDWITKNIMPAIRKAIDFITTNVLPALGRAFDWIVKNVVPVFVSAFEWIIKNVLPTLSSAFGFLVNKVLPALGSALGWIGKNVIPPIVQGLGLLGDGARLLGGIFGTLASNVSRSWNSILGSVRGVINTIIRGWNNLQFRIPSVDLGPLGRFGGFSIGTPNIPYLHTGGIVPGTPGADVLTMLQAGERVLPRGSSGGGPSIVININGGVIDGPTLDRIQTELTRRLRYASGV